MKPWLKKIWQRKKLSAFLGIILILVVYYGYKGIFPSVAPVRYVMAVASKGTLVVSLSGSGSVSASNQVDLKPKASGVVTYVSVVAGQTVRAGALLVQLDASNVASAVRDAQNNLDSAQLSMQKLTQATDALSLIQAQNALATAQQSKQDTTDNLTKTYNDGFNTISNTFLDLPTIMTGLNNILYGNDFGRGQWNSDVYLNEMNRYSDQAIIFRDDAIAKYQKAKTEYDQTFSDYKAMTRDSATGTIESMVAETYNTSKDIAEAVKSTNNFIQLYKDTLIGKNLKTSPLADTHLASLNSYTGMTNIQLSNLLNIKQTIQSDKDSLVADDRTIAEKTESLKKLQVGTDPLDIKAQQLSITQRQNALYDAQNTYADYFVRAPFDGVVAAINVKRGDTTGSTSAVTMITQQKIADISLNEVDVAKIKVGQKATLTFDALPDLTITGDVASIDTLGTITQSVVTYNVKISFDTQDVRVKPGMSVSTAIITDVKQDVVMVPNSAVKNNTVQIMVNGKPETKNVEVGIANDTMTEIISGVAENDNAVTQTITGTTTTTPTTSGAGGGIRIPGVGGGFGR